MRSEAISIMVACTPSSSVLPSRIPAERTASASAVRPAPSRSSTGAPASSARSRRARRPAERRKVERRHPVARRVAQQARPVRRLGEPRLDRRRVVLHRVAVERIVLRDRRAEGGGRLEVVVDVDVVGLGVGFAVALVVGIDGEDAGGRVVVHQRRRRNRRLVLVLGEPALDVAARNRSVRNLRRRVHLLHRAGAEPEVVGGWVVRRWKSSVAVVVVVGREVGQDRLPVRGGASVSSPRSRRALRQRPHARGVNVNASRLRHQALSSTGGAPARNALMKTSHDDK